MRTLALFLLIAALASGQRILYNEGLDKKGKEAKAAADKLASVPVTSKQLENLARIEKLQIESALRDGELTMRTQIQTFRSWSDVSLSVCRTLRFLYADGNLLSIASPPFASQLHFRKAERGEGSRRRPQCSTRAKS
jgi:hypothetical protein